MSSSIFRNHNKKAIRELLKEIGKHRYEMALENMKVQQPPLSMKGWYLEANQHCIFLCYQYPSRVVLRLMKVEGFQLLPKEGWELVKQKRYL